MLRILSIALISFFCANTLFAQDTLYKLDREVILVKVQQVGPTEIVYKRSAALDGPLYVISNEDVWKIIYPDGHVDLFNDPNYVAPNLTPINYHPFTAGINAFDLMLGIVTVNAEYNFGKTGLSVRVPFSFGLAHLAGSRPTRYINYNSDGYYYYNKDKIFSTGLALHYSVAPVTSRISYYFGVSWEYGQCRYLNQQYYYPYPNPYPEPTVVTEWYTATGITNGVVFKPTDHLSIGIELSGGVVVSGNQNNNFNPMARLGVNMGWRFGKACSSN